MQVDGHLKTLVWFNIQIMLTSLSKTENTESFIKLEFHIEYG